jgi:hypothetical protein
MIYREIASGVVTRGILQWRWTAMCAFFGAIRGRFVFTVWPGTDTLMSLLEFLIGELEICF